MIDGIEVSFFGFLKFVDPDVSCTIVQRKELDFLREVVSSRAIIHQNKAFASSWTLDDLALQEVDLLPLRGFVIAPATLGSLTFNWFEQLLHLIFL